MDNLFQTSLFAGVTVSLVAYLLGMLLKKKFKLAILNPLLISIVLTIIVLVVADVDYDTYNKGASYLSWFLTPATVCLAIPLYEQWTLLKSRSCIHQLWRTCYANPGKDCFLCCVLRSCIYFFHIDHVYGAG